MDIGDVLEGDKQKKRHRVMSRILPCNTLHGKFLSAQLIFMPVKLAAFFRKINPLALVLIHNFSIVRVQAGNPPSIVFRFIARRKTPLKLGEHMWSKETRK